MSIDIFETIIVAISMSLIFLIRPERFKKMISKDGDDEIETGSDEQTISFIMYLTKKIKFLERNNKKLMIKNLYMKEDIRLLTAALKKCLDDCKG